MDLILTSEEYMDFPCGTPTLPRGEPRYCCRQCPSIQHALTLKAAWASNPTLLSFLTDAERHEVLMRAAALGPLVVNIMATVPPAVPNANPEPLAV